MNYTRGGGPAFPVTLGESLGGPLHGMSLRDYFAAAALPACLVDAWAHEELDAVAVEDAYSIADAMLAERSKGGDK